MVGGRGEGFNRKGNVKNEKKRKERKRKPLLKEALLANLCLSHLLDIVNGKRWGKDFDWKKGNAYKRCFHHMGKRIMRTVVA